MFEPFTAALVEGAEKGCTERQQSLLMVSRMPEDTDEAAARKLAEGFGGKLDVIYWMTSGPYDGFAVFEFPDDVTAAASAALARSSGNFQRNESLPILNADEFKATMQKVKDVKGSTAYTAPTQTK